MAFNWCFIAFSHIYKTPQISHFIIVEAKVQELRHRFGWKIVLMLYRLAIILKIPTPSLSGVSGAALTCIVAL